MQHSYTHIMAFLKGLLTNYLFCLLTLSKVVRKTFNNPLFARGSNLVLLNCYNSHIIPYNLITILAIEQGIRARATTKPLRYITKYKVQKLV